MRKITLAAMLTVSAALLAGCGKEQAPVEKPAVSAPAPAPKPDTTNLTLPEARENYTVEKTADGYAIKNTKTGVVTKGAADLKRVHFTDQSLALDIESSGRIYRLYQATFNRTPDLAGLGFWLHSVERGAPLEEVATQFMQSKEFQDLYGKNPSDKEFMTKLYKNVLHRAPDKAGLDYWLKALKEGTSRAQAIVNMSEGAENVAQVAPTIANGIPYAKQ
jgi:hypothetical protein